MKLSKLWSPMSDLNQTQRDISNTAVGLSSCLLGIIMVAAQTLPANAQRMGWGNDSGGGTPFPSRPEPAPAPAPEPTYTPQPTPAPPSTVQYGTFRPYGPLPPGRVNVQIDGSFEQAQIMGYNIWVQDNGAQGSDQMVIEGPAGREDVWINCWVTEEWKSFGNNTKPFVHGIVASYCDW